MTACTDAKKKPLQAPFPWFGGKSRVAALVWERFGDVANYVEPFFGSGAVLLGNPNPPKNETINDKDGFVCNFWRAVARDPEETARYADWPINENDLHARHIWMLNQREELRLRLEGDPEYFDAKVAGWWVWGISCWIGGLFCSPCGPWNSENGKLSRTDSGNGVSRQLPRTSRAGVHKITDVFEWFRRLSNRLRRVRVCCGDFERILGYSPTYKLGTTGVFLDPPYSVDADRDAKLYAEEDLSVAHRAREWCLKNGDNPLLRIALCGYEWEHKLPGWIEVEWKTQGGYGNLSSGRGRRNAARERILFSPHCLGSGSNSIGMF